MAEPVIVVRNIVPVMDGVTTVVVGFLFVCLIFPRIVKNRNQYYAALTAILLVIGLHMLNLMIQSPGFGVFAGVLTGLFQIIAIVLLVLCVGGLTIRDLANDMGRAYEVIRRGEEEKEIVIPIPGQKPKARNEPAAPPERINLTSEVQSPPKPEPGSSLPLE